MSGRIISVVAVVLLCAVPALAQDPRVEINVFGGFTGSEGVPVQPREVDGETFNTVTPTSGGSYGVNFGVFISEQAQVGFQFAQQFSTLEGKGSGTARRDFVDMKVNNYHGIFTYHFGYSDQAVLPFIFGGLGATQYSPSDFEGIAVESTTKFSTTWGGGVKFFASPTVGITATARWTPTYINSSPGGIWCNPWWPGGCYQLANSNYSNQFEMSGGVAFRF